MTSEGQRDWATGHRQLSVQQLDSLVLVCLFSWRHVMVGAGLQVVRHAVSGAGSLMDCPAAHGWIQIRMLVHVQQAGASGSLLIA
jgi:hypothetical protein